MEMEMAIKYAEDDGLKLKTVTTIDGTIEYFKNCIKLNENYYKKEVQVVQIDKKWYPINSGIIFYNYETKGWAIKKRGVKFEKGVVGTMDDGIFVYGEFTPNSYTNCEVWHCKNGEKLKEICMNYKILEKLGFVGHINEGIWAAEDFFGDNTFTDEELSYLPSKVSRIIANLYACSKSSFITPKEYDFQNNAYNAEEANNYSSAIKKYDDFTVDLTKDVKRAGRMLGTMTFGCEIETKKGMLPPYLINQLGIVICKDGSINYTPEFVTVPLQGAKGLQTLQNLFIELNKRCTTDYTCSLHFHFGGIRKDREFIVALYKLYCDVQRDLHAMLPHYKTDPRGIKKDDKNYCQFLDKGLVMRHINTSVPYKDKVNGACNSIHTWLLEGNNPCKEFNRKNKHHPNGKTKWNLHSRYYSLNFLNMFTSNRNTMEFRAHQAVLSHTKALNWFFICAAIIKYAEANSSAIIVQKEEFKLEDVINYYGSTFKTPFSVGISDYLNAYVKSRQDYFGKAFLGGERICKEDYIEKDFVFEHKGVRGIF